MKMQGVMLELPDGRFVSASLKVLHTSFREGPGILSASGVNRLYGQCDIDITGYRLRGETERPVPVDAQAYNHQA